MAKTFSNNDQLSKKRGSFFYSPAIRMVFFQPYINASSCSSKSFTFSFLFPSADLREQLVSIKYFVQELK